MMRIGLVKYKKYIPSPNSHILIEQHNNMFTRWDQPQCSSSYSSAYWMSPPELITIPTAEWPTMKLTKGKSPEPWLSR